MKVTRTSRLRPLLLTAGLSFPVLSGQAGPGLASPPRAARAGPARTPARKNLVTNGNFEKGSRPGPHGWQLPDGLTSFWVRTPGGKGRSIKINTDVLASQFRQREDEMELAREKGRPAPPAPKRIPTRDPKYDTVAGLDGVHFTSDKISVDPAKHYKLQVDVRVEGKAAPKVWVKAYAERTSRGGTRTRVVWKKSLNCKDADATWATYTMVFPRNTRIPAAVSHIRIQLYPYWPPATYYFDNVRLCEIDEKEARAYDLERDLRAPIKKKS
jgi:hypothetical protein